MLPSQTSKPSTDEIIEKEAVSLKATLTQLQKDVEAVMTTCTHADAATRHISNSALKQLKEFQRKLEKSIEGKERVLRSRKSTTFVVRAAVKLLTGASMKIGVSAEDAKATEREIMQKFQLESQEAMEKYGSNIPENPAPHQRNYFSQNIQQPLPIPATHPQVPGSSSHQPVKYLKTKPAVISSQYRTPATTTREYIFESEEPIQKGKSSEESIRIGQRIVSPKIFGKGDPEVIGAFVKARYQTTPTKASSTLTGQAQTKTSNSLPSGASSSQAQTHHASSGKSKQTSHREPFEMPPARNMARRREENVPSSSQRSYGRSSTSSSLRAPSRDLRGSINSLEYQELEYGPQYDSEYDSSDDNNDTREAEESTERASIASRDTFGQPKHAKHSYGGAGNTQGGSPYGYPSVRRQT